MTLPKADSNPAKDGLESAADYLKYTLALATGALVFSTGLVTQDIVIPPVARCFLMAAWVILVVSIIAGLLTFARIPVQLHDANYSLEDRFLAYPWRCHQIAFGLAIASLGVTLILILNAKGAA